MLKGIARVVLLCFMGTLLAEAQSIRVLAWSERTEPADVYPDGINGTIAAALKKDKKISVRTAQLSDPDSGVSDAVLDETDVLIWFGHQKHAQVSAEVIARIVRHV